MRFLNAIAGSIFGGGLILAGFLAAQLRTGYPSEVSLIIGVFFLAFGLLLMPITVIGIKLNRIEDRLNQADSDFLKQASDDPRGKVKP